MIIFSTACNAPSQSLFFIDKLKEQNKKNYSKPKLSTGNNLLSFGNSRPLDILVLHGKAHGKSKLANAAIKRGHRVSLVEVTDCIPGINEGRHTLFVRKEGKVKPIMPQDIVLTRLGNLRKEPNLVPTVVEHIKSLSTVIINDITAILAAHDKFKTHQILAAANIPTPNTYYLTNNKKGLAEKVQHILDCLSGKEVILKVNNGSQGIGVFKLPRKEKALIEKIRNLHKNQPVIVQEFLASTEKATDIRCFVIGDEVISMKRSGKDPEGFRSNLHLGGVGSLTELSPEEEKAAIASAKALGFEVAGVDLMRVKGQKTPFNIIEVNGNPGYGIIKATGVDVADLTVQYAENLFKRQSVNVIPIAKS
jgi:ribosomal protein S6--L-glutamate ligase